MNKDSEERTPPHITDDGKCSDCKVDVDMGYGLAGGGIGVYTYCPDCGFLFDKTQDPGI